LFVVAVLMQFVQSFVLDFTYCRHVHCKNVRFVAHCEPRSLLTVLAAVWMAGKQRSLLSHTSWLPGFHMFYGSLDWWET